MDQTQEREKAGRGNDGLLESLGKTVRLFFPPFPQTLEIDGANFHITTATATTGMNLSKTKERRETSSNNYRELWLSLTGKIS